MRTVLFHPEVTGRTCYDCRRYIFADTAREMGEQCFTRDRDGRMTLPVHRPRNSAPPCHQCPKIPDGELPRPENAVEMTEQNWRTYQHYRECRAVGVFPDDPIVRRNAATLRGIEDAAGRQGEAKIDALITAILLR